MSASARMGREKRVGTGIESEEGKERIADSQVCEEREGYKCEEAEGRGIAIRSTSALLQQESSECLFDAKITVFAKKEIERQSEKREATDRIGERQRGEGEKRGKRDSSIITSFHLFLDVRMMEEEPPTVKSFDGFFRPTIRSTNLEPQKSDLDHTYHIGSRCRV